MVAGSPAGPVDTTRSPGATLQTLDARAVTIDGGFWAARQAVNRQAALPHGLRMLESAGNLDNLRIAALIYDLIRGLAAEGKAVLLVDQNIKRALEIADYVYVMRTGTVLSEGSREAFGGDTEALVARWLYASGDA